MNMTPNIYSAPPMKEGETGFKTVNPLLWVSVSAFIFNAIVYLSAWVLSDFFIPLWGDGPETDAENAFATVDAIMHTFIFDYSSPPVLLTFLSVWIIGGLLSISWAGGWRTKPGWAAHLCLFVITAGAFALALGLSPEAHRVFFNVETLSSSSEFVFSQPYVFFNEGPLFFSLLPMIVFAAIVLSSMVYGLYRRSSSWKSEPGKR